MSGWMEYERMRTLRCRPWISEEFFPEIIFSSPGIKPHRRWSASETSCGTHHKTHLTNMKNKINKIREVRQLIAESDHIEHNHEQERDGIDRRGFLKCMAWAGTGMLWTGTGGVLGSKILRTTLATA